MFDIRGYHNGVLVIAQSINPRTHYKAKAQADNWSKVNTKAIA